MNEVDDAELKKVMADFLELGHVENIIAMYRHDPRYYDWTGEILDDERFAVRIGVSVLFEELTRLEPEQTQRAVPSLAVLLQSESANIRGEAIGVLGIIGGEKAISQIRAMENDPSPQVREMVDLVLEESA
ncbi:HEAT repeat domain-containing protein [Desulfosediminicola ganghwensis]|uniref:HEAT repeat domain-containing protein n=1 Tax=Desulfosediminicola ganghwensis TaxID=2569540 RepID=UPI0010ABEFD8|nr:HEAT repeat domain-containing protein [Desulfosediminicola ganghwensis]